MLNANKKRLICLVTWRKRNVLVLSCFCCNSAHAVRNKRRFAAGPAKETAALAEWVSPSPPMLT